MSSSNLKIAALACCYNRKVKTSLFLESLSSQFIPQGYSLDIYLLDDQSSDGTVDYVKRNFPHVIIVEGSGSLYWAGGMRTVWGHASKRENYDFYILLNDDVKLLDNSIARLLDSHKQSQADQNIIIGTVRDEKTLALTYGGHKIKSRLTGYTTEIVPADNDIRPCDLGNANIMLVDKETVGKIGILSDEYIHGLADYDYTLTATRNGVSVWVAPGYYGYCENDHGKTWLPRDASFKKRLAYLYSPTGLAYKEYLHYVWKFYPQMLPNAFVKVWMKTLFPMLYDTLKK